MPPCAACKEVIDGRQAAGAALGFRDSLLASPEHWRDASDEARAAVLARVRSDLAASYRYVREFVGVNSLAVSLVPPEYPNDRKTLLVALVAIAGNTDVIGAFCLANAAQVASMPLAAEVAQWQCDTCDYLDHISRELAGLLPEPY